MIKITTKKQHTPGPWTAVRSPKDNIGYNLILQEKQHEAANIAMVVPFVDTSKVQFEANSKLIAAVPELVSALTEVTALYMDLSAKQYGTIFTPTAFTQAMQKAGIVWSIELQ